LVCISTHQQPLLCEHLPNHCHLLAGRECGKILAVELIVIIFDPDNPDLHPPPSLGSTLLRLRIRFAFHIGVIRLERAQSLTRPIERAWLRRLPYV
jgi:hypothetical protein